MIGAIMSETASVGTDFSKELLEETAAQKPGVSVSGPAASERSFAESVQEAIDRGADLDWIQRRFHLSESELSDYCADIMDDGFDEDRPESASGY